MITFEDVRYAALGFREEFYPECEESYDDIIGADSIEAMRRVAIKYRSQIVNHTNDVRRCYNEELDVLGLFIQRFIGVEGGRLCIQNNELPQGEKQ